MRRRGGADVVVLSAALLAMACDSTLERFPLRDRVLATLATERPFALRLDEAALPTRCSPREIPGGIPGIVCSEHLSSAALSSLAALSGPVSTALATEASADALWAAALLDLVTVRFDAEALDRVIARLEAVVIREPDEANAHGHLAVALAVRAESQDDPSDLFAALDAAERAVDLRTEPTFLVFNQAVLRAAIHADSQALVALSHAAAGDGAGRWRAEHSLLRADIAGRRATKGTVTANLRHLASADHQRVREYVIDSLVAHWSLAAGASDGPSQAAIADTAQRLAAVLVDRHGDSSAFHVARELAQLRGQRAHGAVEHYVAGAHAFARLEFETATLRLHDATRLLELERAPAFADWARLWLAASTWSRGDYDTARRLVARITASAQRRRDIALHARALWLEALIAGRAGDLHAAAGSLVRSDSLFSHLGEHVNAAFVQAILAEIHQVRGQAREAARRSFRSLTLPSLGGEAVRHEQWLVLGQQLQAQGLGASAEVAIDEALLAARHSRRAKDLPEAIARRVQLHVAQGDKRSDGQFSSLLRSGRAALAGIDGSATRLRAEAELDRAEARLIGASDPDSALRLLDRSATVFATIPVERASLHAARSLLLLDRRDVMGARREAERALALSEEIGERSLPGDRRSLQLSLRAMRREIAQLALSDGDTAEVWRQVLGLTGSPEGRVSRRGSAEDGPASATRVHLVALRDHLVTVVEPKDSGRRWRTAEIPRSTLTGLVDQFRALVRSGADTATEHQLGARLGNLLLGEFTSLADANGAVQLSTDEVFADLPWGALRDEAGGHLAERLAVTVLVASNPDRERIPGNPAPRGLLLVSDPAWSPDQYPDLEPLSWATAETEAIRQIDADAVVLGGQAATKVAFASALARATAVHFAGHAQIGEAAMTSHLVLSADLSGAVPEDDGRLTASEIQTMGLGHLRLAVLSSCGRPARALAPSEPVNELVRALVVAGVNHVVAASWEIEDDAIPGIMSAFHRHRIDGRDPAEALRRATVEGIARGGPTRRAALAMTVYTSATR